MQHTILCVDDEQDNVDALERLFRKDYRVLKATSGKQALSLLKANDVTVIICDQRMPEMPGVEFLTKSITTHPDAIRILLTGYTDVEAVIAAINSGQIYRYVTKPWDSRDLVAAVKRAVERFEMGRTLQEKNIALEKALKELSVLDQAKSHFMILISHELKTPLTSVLSFLDLLKETSLDEDQVKYVDRVAKGARRLKDIIFDMLELVSAETGTMTLKPEKISTRKLIQDSVDEFRDAATERNLKFVINATDLQIWVDQKSIKNVIRRIMHNAVKFAEPDSQIEIKSSSSDEFATFEIHNVGKPISKEDVDRILKPFAVDENIMHHSKGTGLGLSICQALLRLHSSQLEINSDNHSVRVGFSIRMN